jgi:acetyltransferase-like isoleucine patch superfamily enzyme
MFELLNDILNKYRFHKSAERIGPDMPFSHWRLYFKSKMIKLCKSKFLYFGEGADFRPHCYAMHCSNISIGKNVVVRPGSVIEADEYAKVIIGDDVMLGPNVYFYVNDHKFERRDIPLSEQGYYPSEDIVVKSGAWIGANSTILCGVTIGKNAVVGAGSVVTKNVPDFTIVVGVPAKKIKEF